MTEYDFVPMGYFKPKGDVRSDREFGGEEYHDHISGHLREGVRHHARSVGVDRVGLSLC